MRHAQHCPADYFLLALIGHGCLACFKSSSTMQDTVCHRTSISTVIYINLCPLPLVTEKVVSPHPPLLPSFLPEPTSEPCYRQLVAVALEQTDSTITAWSCRLCTTFDFLHENTAAGSCQCRPHQRARCEANEEWWEL